MSKEKTKAKRKLLQDPHFLARRNDLRKKILHMRMESLLKESKDGGYSPKIGRLVKAMEREMKRL